MESDTASLKLYLDFITESNEDNFDYDLHQAEAALTIFFKYGFRLHGDLIRLAALLAAEKELPDDVVLVHEDLPGYFLIFTISTKHSVFSMVQEPEHDEALTDFDLDELVADHETLLEELGSIIVNEQKDISLTHIIESLIELEQFMEFEDIQKLLEFVEELEARHNS